MAGARTRDPATVAGFALLDSGAMPTAPEPIDGPADSAGPATQADSTGVRPLLAPGHWAYLLLLLVPLSLVDLLCQTQRSVGTGVGFGTAAYFDAIRSTACFDLAMIVFWLGAFAVVRRPRSRKWLTAALHVWFTVYALLVVIGEVYFLLLDVVLNLESFELVKLIFQVEMAKIIQAEVKGWMLFIVLALVLAANYFPVLVNWWWKPRRISRPAPQVPAGTARTRKVLALTGAGVIALLVLSGLPDTQGTTNFTRARAVSFAMDGVSRSLADKPAGFRAPRAADLPLHTRLVPTRHTKRYNVVQIVLESEGWQATSLGSPELDTTPRLAELARTSLVARRAYTAVPHTTKSLIASNCGVAPPLDTANSEAEPGGLAARCLPSLLAEQGYATAFFQTATHKFENRDKVVDAFGYQDFQSLESLDKKGFSPTNTLGYEDDAMLGPSIDWARKHRDQPFLMEYMTLTAHAEYVLPKGFATRTYVEDPTHNDYLNAVRYQDRFVGKVIDEFKRAGLYDHTIFVIMGDHGEGFREHGRRLHNDTIWNEGLQIPYVIHSPDHWQDGAVLDTPVQNIATLPTLVDLLGFRIQGKGKYDGSSILRNGGRQPGPLVSSCWDIDQCLAYFDDKGHKYIYFFGYRPPEYYDLNVDPREKHDLYDTLSEKEQRRLKNLVLRWQAQVDARHELSRKLAQD